MLALSVKELLESDTREITLQDTYWPTSFIDVVDVSQHELKEHPELQEVARATLLNFCLMWGGSYLYMPVFQKMLSFVIAKHLFDASKVGEEQLSIAVVEGKVKQCDVQDYIASQIDIHNQLKEARNSCKQSYWCIETIQIIDQLNDCLDQTDLSTNDRLLIRKAILISLCKMRGRGVINVPSCSKISIEIRRRIIFRKFTGSNARLLAREFNLSVAHIHRNIKSEYERRRSAKN